MFLEPNLKLLHMIVKLHLFHFGQELYSHKLGKVDYDKTKTMKVVTFEVTINVCVSCDYHQ